MNIYILKNFTLKEVYYGLAEGNAREAANTHKENLDSPLGHWKFGEEEIKWGLVQQEFPDNYAQAYLDAIRREPPEDDWILVMGFG